MARALGMCGGILVAGLLLGTGCGDDSGGGPAADAGRDAASASVSGGDCAADADCDDGIYCNGTERCRAGSCMAGEVVTCDDGIACTTDRCSHAANSCLFEPADADADGHTDRGCLDPDGEPLGDDCDDTDADRFPGNPERCDLADPDHDEDCDDASYGSLDVDQDGYVDSRCCSVTTDGDTSCGTDCADDDPARFPEHPEICDGIDNDCEGSIDVGTEEVPWYVDADGDGYGNASDAPVESCAPIAGRSLRDTDCNDTRASVHPAAREVCDQLDNDCDAADDEDGVCDCAPAGGKQACACDDTSTGSQLCVDGAWSACDCTECISGVRDCLGDLIPRECLDGRWTVYTACSGARPICLAGQCVCVDGTTSCDEVEDVIAPFVFGTNPLNDTTSVAPSAVVAVVFSEQVKPSTVTAQTFSLQDGYGNAVAATLAVGTTTVTLKPGAPLLNGMAYTARVTTGITDLAGNALPTDREWTFMTVPGPALGQIAPPANVTFSSPSLAMNASGNALLVLGDALASGDTVTPRVSATARISGSWLAPTVLMNATGPYPDNVAMDDANKGFTMLNTGATSSIFTFDGASWTATAPYGINVGNQLEPPGAVEGSGYGVAIAKNPSTDTLGYRARAQDGTFAAAVYSGSVADTGFARADVGPGGYGGIGWINTTIDAVELWHSAAGLTNWVRATAFTSSGTMTAQEVATDASGRVLQVWAEVISGGGAGGEQQRVAARLIAADNSQVGAVVDLLPYVDGTWQADPRADFDASGNAIVLARDADTLHALRYVPASGWSSPVQLSVDGSMGLATARLAVSANGAALAVWRQAFWLTPGGLRELWCARFTPASGWAPAQRISTPAAAVSSFDVAMDATGGSLVVWEEAGFAGLRSATP